MPLSKKSNFEDYLNHEVVSYLDFFDKNELEEFTVRENGISFTLKKEADKTGQVFQNVVAPSLMDKTVDIERDSGLARDEVGEPVQKLTSLDNDTSQYTAVKSPVTGTYYEAPSPEDPPFVKPGQQVKSEDTVCIIEAMKVMNHVTAKADGKIVNILIKNGDAVTKDQTIMYIE